MHFLKKALRLAKKALVIFIAVPMMCVATIIGLPILLPLFGLNFIVASVKAAKEQVYSILSAPLQTELERVSEIEDSAHAEQGPSYFSMLKSAPAFIYSKLPAMPKFAYNSKNTERVVKNDYNYKKIS